MFHESVYCRYPDDIFVLITTFERILKLKNALINNSVVNLMNELERAKQ